MTWSLLLWVVVANVAGAALLVAIEERHRLFERRTERFLRFVRDIDRSVRPQGFVIVELQARQRLRTTARARWAHPDGRHVEADVMHDRARERAAGVRQLREGEA